MGYLGLPRYGKKYHIYLLLVSWCLVSGPIIYSFTYDKTDIMTAADEAKQLDSVTDRVAETELDSSRANQALGALAAAKQSEVHSSTVKQEDVDVIVAELECLREEAVESLKKSLEEDGTLEGEELISHALTRLVSS